MEFGGDSMETRTLENGRALKLRGMECIIGRMETGMKVSGNNV